MFLQVTGAEARDFFLSTGLPKATLSNIWVQATKGHSGGLGWPQFLIALRQACRRMHPINGPRRIGTYPHNCRLVGSAQAGAEVDDRLGALARLAPGQRQVLPTPRLGAPAAAPARVVAPPAPSGPPPAYDQVVQGSGGNPPAPVRLLCPAAAPIRLPPQQRGAGELSVLAGFRGSLLAGPSGSGGLLQYWDAEGSMASLPPTGSTSRTEDGDCAPAAEWAPSEAQGAAAAVTCLAADPASGGLVTGHRDAGVIYWDGSSGALRRLGRVQAHRFGCVSAVALAPQGKLLWTGSSWGSLRAWPDFGQGEAVATAWSQAVGQGTHAHVPVPLLATQWCGRVWGSRPEAPPRPPWT